MSGDTRNMKIAVGAPVAGRAWILQEWRRRLQHQTLRPSAYCFVYSYSEDDTYKILGDKQWGGRVIVHKTLAPYYSRTFRNTDQNDPHRAKHFSTLRNTLLAMFLRTDADLFVSLDTDVLLDDHSALERLTQTIQDGWDTASALTYLHPLGERSHCYNAGYLTGGVGFTQGWRRAEQNEVLAYRSPVKIDVPMAAVMMTHQVAKSCRYKAHECGEDIGFGQSLAQHGFRSAWRTDLVVRHVWDETYLRREEEECSVEAAAWL